MNLPLKCYVLDYLHALYYHLSLWRHLRFFVLLWCFRECLFELLFDVLLLEKMMNWLWRGWWIGVTFVIWAISFLARFLYCYKCIHSVIILFFVWFRRSCYLSEELDPQKLWNNLSGFWFSTVLRARMFNVLVPVQCTYPLAGQQQVPTYRTSRHTIHTVISTVVSAHTCSHASSQPSHKKVPRKRLRGSHIFVSLRMISHNLA